MKRLLLSINPRDTDFSFRNFSLYKAERATVVLKVQEDGLVVFRWFILFPSFFFLWMFHILQLFQIFGGCSKTEKREVRKIASSMEQCFLPLRNKEYRGESFLVSFSAKKLEHIWGECDFLFQLLSGTIFLLSFLCQDK